MPRRLLIPIALLLLLTALAPGLRSPGVRSQSAPVQPIVIAQGVVSFTGDPIDWRVYEREAHPDAPRDPVSAAAGFTLVDEGGLIVADANSGRESLLSAGEAAFSNDGESLVINTEAGESAAYRRIVLLPDDFVDEPESEAAFESDGFTVAAGKREIELAVGSIPDANTTLRVEEGEEGLSLLLVLAGEVVHAGEEPGEPLAAGDYLEFTDEVDITSAEAEVPAQIAVVRIGPTVRDVTQPLPDAGTPDGDSGEDPVENPEGTGTLVLQPQVCAMGGVTGGCTNRPDAALLEISGPGLTDGPLYSSSIPPADDGTIVLPALPYGDYTVRNLDFETGVFEVEGGTPDPNNPSIVYVTLSDANPELIVTVRRVPPTGDGVIAVELYVCPDGLPASWAQPWFCAVDRSGWSLSLTSDAYAGSLTTNDAPTSDAGYTFGGLPVGYEYRLSLDATPAGYPIVQIDPNPMTEGPIRIALSLEYSVQAYRFYAATAGEIDLSGADSDGDGLPDAVETDILGTDPTVTDTDGDSVWDDAEVSNGTNPFDPTSYSFG